MYRFLRIMRIVDLFCWTTIRLQVGQVLAGCMLGRLTEVGPCELSTVVPVEEHTRLVSPGQDTCDLDGGVEFLICVGSGFCQSKFYFALCRCVVFGRHSCDIGGILVGVCVMA